MKISKKCLTLSLLFIGLPVFGDESDRFDSLWREISEKSHEVNASKSEHEASKIGMSRASRHWAPRFLLNAQVMSTNDPGTSLFSLLGSRTLQASDLSTGSMNHPSREWYERGGVTMDWVLFEGGSKQAASRGKEIESESRRLALQAAMKEEYASLARDYAKLISLGSEEKMIMDLKGKLQNLIGRYQLGSKQNPVGYSGLLGMRALQNRLESSLDQTRAESFSLNQSIQVKSGRIGQPIRPSEKSQTSLFAETAFTTHPSAVKGLSYRAESMRLSSDAQAEYSNAERAKWLPKVGLYTSGNLTAGPRGSGTSTEVGAYLQWELFNAGNVGAYQESSLRAAASRERSDGMIQKSQIDYESLTQSIPVLRENLKRIENSLELTTEQVQVTEKLFKNGAINALQLVEVLSRRADTIQNKRQVEYAYVEGLAALYLQKGSQP